MRKIGAAANAGSRRPRTIPASKSKNTRKRAAQNPSARRRKNSAENPALARTRPPPPGQGKRGEQGYLAYLLRQAQAATRLAMERALADLGATPPRHRPLQHPAMDRVLQWTVTRRGAALLDKCRRHAQVIERRLVAGLSAGSQRTIRRWLAQIAADL